MRRWDVDLKNMRVWIPHGSTKNGRGQYKPIPPEMRAYFESIPADCDYVFHRRENGRYLSLGDFKNAWYTCLHIAGIEDYRFHDLRHNACAYLIEVLGLPEYAVREIGNWKSPEMLSRYHGFTSANACSIAHRFFSNFSNEKPQKKPQSGSAVLSSVCDA